MVDPTLNRLRIAYLSLFNIQRGGRSTEKQYRRTMVSPNVTSTTHVPLIWDTGTNTLDPIMKALLALVLKKERSTALLLGYDRYREA